MVHHPGTFASLGKIRHLDVFAFIEEHAEQLIEKIKSEGTVKYAKKVSMEYFNREIGVGYLVSMIQELLHEVCR